MPSALSATLAPTSKGGGGVLANLHNFNIFEHTATPPARPPPRPARQHQSISRDFFEKNPAKNGEKTLQSRANMRANMTANMRANMANMTANMRANMANMRANMFAHLRGAKNVTSIENCPTPLAAMFIDPSGPFANSSEIYKTNLFTKFHDGWAKNVTSRVHVIQLTGTIFQLNSRIKETIANNVTSRVFTCFHYKHIEKNAPPNGGSVFSLIWTIFELVRHINKPMKTAPPTGGHIHEDLALNVTSTVFELDPDFIGMKLLNKFHGDRTINVASRVLTGARLKLWKNPIRKVNQKFPKS
ncbi:hypothetical protein DPMN_122419 [Dreissena polymorpha]|uniref:Uncharacterized protein n=1 Tax=Dreissena polymorpha TaxID=45954 RepID=A0A9D4JQJ0_DREPO|nr:hypothetical protein DPMN_122419 [Dreissena polymorpha]